MLLTTTASKVQESCIFVSNKYLGQLLDTLPENFIFSKTFNSEFSYIEVWSTDQNANPLEIENKINITLFINCSVKYKKWHAIQFNQQILQQRQQPVT